jgi:chemotaxis protein methyltransferase CheR
MEQQRTQALALPASHDVAADGLGRSARGATRQREHGLTARAYGCTAAGAIDGVMAGDRQFFRTPAIWWYLDDEFLPMWHARAIRKAGTHTGAPLRIWLAQAGTGEDAYSLAMLCLEFQRRHPSFHFEIDGTDVSTQALAAACAGEYAGHTVEHLAARRPALFHRYLQAGPAGFSVTGALRRHVRFGPHDLAQGPRAIGHYDLVMLRNVLNRVDTPGQERVLAQVREAMRPGAKLILGERESIARLESPFAFEQAHVYHIDEASV